jgi:hypothetical protein
MNHIKEAGGNLSADRLVFVQQVTESTLGLLLTDRFDNLLDTVTRPVGDDLAERFANCAAGTGRPLQLPTASMAAE